jgi:transcriptional regulator with XRE-family HTH domain
MIEAIKLILKEKTLFDLFFIDGSIKRYDILTLAKKFPQLNALKDRKLFLKGHLMGGGVVWNEELDIEGETVYEDGADVTNEYDDTDISNIVIGCQIKQKRLEQFMSQEELAKALGYTNRSSINKIEIGRSNIPTDKIAKMAEVLGVSPLDLFEGGEPPIEEETIVPFDFNKLSEDNQKRLLAYYQALIDSQEG